MKKSNPKTRHASRGAGESSQTLDSRTEISDLSEDELQEESMATMVYEPALARREVPPPEPSPYQGGKPSHPRSEESMACRIHMRIPCDLKKEAESFADQEGISLSQMVERLVQDAVRQSKNQWLTLPPIKKHKSNTEKS